MASRTTTTADPPATEIRPDDAVVGPDYPRGEGSAPKSDGWWRRTFIRVIQLRKAAAFAGLLSAFDRRSCIGTGDSRHGTETVGGWRIHD